MNIIFKLAGIVGLHTKEAEEGLDKVSKKGEKTKKKMSKAFSKIGKGAKILGAAIATGVGTGMTALVGVGKKALESYADYEQLVGGIDTLFKDSSAKVQQYANEAYKTAGLSANQYMETATGFSASLLQSLGGDTEKAAEMANMAIIDMSDNANKMGTSMESIQVAYQGFAKQNYTIIFIYSPLYV